MISNTEVKRTFKIFLDSNNTSSFIGASIFNASYMIDLTSIIQTDADYDKSYYMNMSFISQANTINNSSIDYANVYTLHVDMGKGLNIYQYRRVKVPSTILQVEVIPPVAAVLATPTNGVITRFNLTDDKSKPTFIQNLRNINMITLNVINTTTNATLTQATATNYVCVLTFVEA